MLGSVEPFPHSPRRVLIAGSSGAGKTTLARRLERVLGLPHTELDSLRHGPSWHPRPTFLDEVDALAQSETWITEWQYANARARLAARADTLVWLDVPTATWMGSLVRRTLRRRIHRELVWNGNVEPPLRTILRDREHVIRYAWTHRRKYRDHLIPDVAAAHPELVIVRLRSRTDVDRWVSNLIRANNRAA